MPVINSFSLLIRVAVIATLLACNKHPENKPASDGVIVPPPVAADTSIKHYLALGDSYTIGESVAIADRFPVITAGILKTQGITLAEPQIIARTGWTTGELQAAVTATRFDYSYDVVTLLIGVNNQYRGGSLAVYRKEFELNLKNAIALAGGKTHRVVVISIPDYSVTPFGQRADPDRISKELVEFNKVNKEVSDSLKVNYLDIVPESRTALNDAGMVAEDNLHFSGKMYRVWAEKIAPVIKANLR